MTIITISRQLGSMGSEISDFVGNQLNCRVVSRDLINQAAIRAGAPETALADIDELGLLGVTLTPVEKMAYAKSLSQVMLELAEAGDVIILGRGGQVILQGYPKVLHVRLVGSLEVRATRLVKEKDISIKAAIEQINASDRHKREFLKGYFNHQLDSQELYDLIINTDKLTPEGAAEIIVLASKRIIQ